MDFLRPRVALIAAGLMVGGCAAVPPPVPPAPAPATSAAPAAPVEEPKPKVPESFAARPVLVPAPPPAPPQSGNTAPADMRPPGWHCHIIGPGKKYCHGGMD